MLIIDLPLRKKIQNNQISRVLPILYQFLEKIFDLKHKKKGPLIVLHPNFPKIWYVRDKTPNFNVDILFALVGFLLINPVSLKSTIKFT